MTQCHTHRSVYHSIFIREVGDNEHRDSQMENTERVGDFEILHGCLYHTSTIKAQNLCRREQKDCKSRCGRRGQGKPVFQAQQGRCTYELRDTVTCTRSSHAKSQPAQRGSKHQVLPIAKKRFAYNSQEERENMFSPMV